MENRKLLLQALQVNENQYFSVHGVNYIVYKIDVWSGIKSFKINDIGKIIECYDSLLSEKLEGLFFRNEKIVSKIWKDENDFIKWNINLIIESEKKEIERQNKRIEKLNKIINTL